MATTNLARLPAAIVAHPRASRRRGRRQDSFTMVVLAMAGYVLLGMSAMSLALRWPAGDLLTARVDAVAFACVGLLLHVLVQPYLPHRLLSARTQRLSLAFASGCAIQWALG